jgi:hypothetical protein
MGFLTNAYVPTSPLSKDSFLDTLYSLNPLFFNHTWLIGGDLNITTSLSQKQGGQRRLDPDSQSFLEAILDIILVNIETTNGNFTWNNHRQGKQQIASHLNLFLVSDSILLANPHPLASILPFTGSDHWSISLHLDLHGIPPNHPFHFKIFYLTHPSFPTLFKTWWYEYNCPTGSPMFKFQQKLKYIKHQLKI